MTNKQRLTHAVIAAAEIFALLLTGCLGVFQEVSQGEDGKTQTFVRLTMSKAMVESMDAMGGEPTDTDEIFDLEDAPFDPENIPGLDNVVVEQVNNEVDLGIRFGGVIAGLPAGVQPEEAPFVPFEDGRNLIIALPPMGEDEEPMDPQSEQFAGMFFASTKYQLSLDKTLYPNVRSAKVVVKGKDSPASVTELAGSWLVEFPFSTWMQASEGCRIVISL